ncbi:MAG: dihydropteroate synthase, partial [Pseudomonadota bacterium]
MSNRAETLGAPAPPTTDALDLLDAPGRALAMGVINATPDSFSDGGRLADPAAALAAAEAMLADGVDILDLGGESTRPGALEVAEAEERRRVTPILAGLRPLLAAAATGRDAAPAISIDTRKPAIARAAFAAGARLWNDVSALGHAPDALETAADLCRGPSGGWICLMHAQGAPETMQAAPRYEDVVEEVYAFLAARIEAATAAGAPEARILIDPGIGFGKTFAHNEILLRGLSRFRALGRPLLVGVSRKGFIGALTGEPSPERRLGGSIAAGLAAVARGARILR